MLSVSQSMALAAQGYVGHRLSLYFHDNQNLYLWMETQFELVGVAGLRSDSSLIGWLVSIRHRMDSGGVVTLFKVDLYNNYTMEAL